jgi:hypothetical protein
MVENNHQKIDKEICQHKVSRGMAWSVGFFFHKIIIDIK